MHVFFQCVAEAVAEKGIRGLAELVPGGGLMFDIAKVTWEKYRQRRQMNQIRADVQQLAQANFEQAKKAAIDAVQPFAAKQPELVPVVEQFLMQIPAATRQSLKRADDPTGTTVPANFSLRGPEDVAKLLPPSLPRFKPDDPLPGKAGWILEKQLGIGGFGEVWLARKSGYESLLGAVKFCRLDTGDRDLLHESKVIDQLLKHGDHPNIVKLMDVHLEGDAPWLMYEYVEGGDLTDLIHEWSALPPNQRQEKALAALQELASAIGHFHRLDPAIVHRDLKPANILRDKLGRLRITDFGISGIAAKHMIENETRGTTTRAARLQSYLYGSYTPLYASPQQKEGAPPDPRDDVHALGVIAYQILTGQVNQGVSSDFAQDLKESGVRRELTILLGRCTAARADRRPQDASRVAEALEGEKEEVRRQREVERIRKEREAEEIRQRKEAERIRKEHEAEEIRQGKVAERIRKERETEEIRQRAEAERIQREHEAAEKRRQKEATRIQREKDVEEAARKVEAEKLEKRREFEGYKGMGRSGYAALAIFLGSLGVHKFARGRKGAGMIHLLVTYFSLMCCVGGYCGACGSLGTQSEGAAAFSSLLVLVSACVMNFGFVEGVTYLASYTDEDFYHSHIVGQKDWF